MSIIKPKNTQKETNGISLFSRLSWANCNPLHLKYLQVFNITLSTFGLTYAISRDSMLEIVEERCKFYLL